MAALRGKRRSYFNFTTFLLGGFAFFHTNVRLLQPSQYQKLDWRELIRTDGTVLCIYILYLFLEKQKMLLEASPRLLVLMIVKLTERRVGHLQLQNS